MRRAPVPSVDLAVYLRAVPVLLRNPTIAVVPLLMAVVGVLIGLLLVPSSGSALGGTVSGLTALVVLLLQMFGVGAACIIADDAWRHGSASFDRGWEETSRRAGDIFMAAIGFSLLLSVAQYVSLLIGVFGIVLLALIAFFLIWTLPAAAIGGVPGGAAIQVSIDRVRANPLQAGITVAVSLIVFFAVAGLLPVRVLMLLPPTTSPIVGTLIQALCQAIAFAYIATILAKTYSDAAFGGRRW